MANTKNINCVLAFLGNLVFVALVCKARVLTETSGFIETNGTKFEQNSSSLSLFNDKPGFVKIMGTVFELNGSPFLFNGFNSYWMMHVAADPKHRYNVSNVFREASAAGLTVCRTWAFSDGGSQALQISPGVYDEHVFEGLDFVVAEAKKYNMRLILSLANNYQDFGGRPQYVQWAKKDGVSVNDDDDFYTNSVIKSYYKNHVERLLSRVNTFNRITYKDDPTIMAWELINEPRCKINYSGEILNGWVQEMASYVKSVDDKHLLAVGMEGFYGDSIPDRKRYNPGYQVGTDFIRNNLIREIDFATIHAYPDSWLSKQNDTIQMTFMERWMSSHWRDSATILKKPLVISEFGKSKKNSGYNINVRNSFINAVYSSIYDLARNGGAFSGGLVWQLVDEGMDSYRDGYEIVLSQDPSTSSIISEHSNKMTALEQSLSSTHGTRTR